VEILLAGGIIAYPTDTTYGLGCDVFQKEALERLRSLRKHHKNKRLSIICPDLKDISKYAHVSNYAFRIMRSVIPGPYTFILNATKLVPKTMLTNQKTVGIRVPDNAIALAIVTALGHPLITTSVTNPEQTEYYTDPEEIEEMFGRGLGAVIDGGRYAADVSTIIDLTDDQVQVLRKGKGDVSFLAEEE
ncbi:MAG TPA: L-threonylcarbamoyladenylate synthase, partial [Thermodesulfobacteriota bacterium]|nr:L-threonylcarbamoyladenylate synthase [Thermodesulfobacteriota bacterium]